MTTYVIAKTPADAAAWAKQDSSVDARDVKAVTRPETIEGVNGRMHRLVVSETAWNNPRLRAILVAAAKSRFEPPSPPGGYTEEEMRYIRGQSRVNPNAEE